MQNFTFKLYSLHDYGRFCDGVNTFFIFATRLEALDFWSIKSGKPAHHAPIDKVSVNSKEELCKYITSLTRSDVK